MTGRCRRSTPTTTFSARPAHEPLDSPWCHRTGHGRRYRLRHEGAAAAHHPRPIDEIAAAAQREQLSYLGLLAELVMAECDDRDKRRATRRIHDAGFPR